MPSISNVSLRLTRDACDVLQRWPAIWHWYSFDQSGLVLIAQWDNEVLVIDAVAYGGSSVWTMTSYDITWHQVRRRSLDAAQCAGRSAAVVCPDSSHLTDSVYCYSDWLHVHRHVDNVFHEMLCTGASHHSPALARFVIFALFSLGL